MMKAQIPDIHLRLLKAKLSNQGPPFWGLLVCKINTGQIIFDQIQHVLPSAPIPKFELLKAEGFS